MESAAVSQTPSRSPLKFGRGVIPEAAKRLGISRTAIYKRLGRADVTTLEILGKIQAEQRRAAIREDHRRQRALKKLGGSVNG